MPVTSQQASVADAPLGIRVMIVDDSAVARAVLQRICNGLPEVSVVASLTNANAALDYLRSHAVDIVLLDIDMPGTDGLTALPDLVLASCAARIVVVSGACEEGSAAAVQAMALGAADTLAKPQMGSLGSSFAAELAARLTRLAPTAERERPVVADVPASSIRPFAVLAISASTGGIHAMSQVLRELPRALDMPILVTQHLPHSFMPYFSAQLALLTGRPCTVAADGAVLSRGRILVAPGDAHLTVRRAGTVVSVVLDRSRSASGCLPSADPMLASLASVYGADAMAVTLSGMGRDGAAGAARIAEAGGQVIVQDPDSAVVWGMPGAVARAGHATAVLPPDRIGAVLAATAR